VFSRALFLNSRTHTKCCREIRGLQQLRAACFLKTTQPAPLGSHFSSLGLSPSPSSPSPPILALTPSPLSPDSSLFTPSRPCCFRSLTRHAHKPLSSPSSVPLGLPILSPSSFYLINSIGMLNVVVAVLLDEFISTVMPPPHPRHA
jgi:hypothetical protein